MDISVILTYALFILGFAALIKGGDILVDGASSLAKKYHISTIVIGLTIVSFGTSAPELIVNILASIKGSSELAIGNVVGSNIANILLILGISAIVYPLAVKKGTTWKEIPLSLLGAIVLALIANDAIIDGQKYSALTRIDGFILLLFFMIFMYYTFGISKASGGEGEKIKQYTISKSIIMIIGGIIALTLGGQWVVTGAIAIAKSLGVSEALIGLTIVAVGTSLPELVTSVMAALKKNPDIAVGNVVGSNIFNIFWILGVSSIIRPINFSTALNFDLIMVIAVTFILFLFMFVGKKRVLEPWQGASFVFLYALYTIFLIYRG